MIALFFEVTPKTGQEGHYLDIATALKPELERNGGLIFLDRYKSLIRPKTLLSHQIWADEASLTRWRTNARHHGAQASGRKSVFEDYRLRVGPVIAEGGEGGGVAPQIEGLPYNDPLLTPERFAIVIRSYSRLVAGGDIGEGFESVYRPGEFAWVGDAPDRQTGYETLRTAASDPCVSAAQLVLVSRDYGLHDRRQAPQYFPPRPD
ncbi:MAG: antibiotic biosynthesis monooxygenase [Hyphomicrobiaceae bacterium]